MLLRKSTLCLIAAGFLGVALPQNSFAYDLSARTIYQQAKKANHGYFQLLRRYRLAVDKVDVRGNTAYCMALLEHNAKAMDFLVKQGANVNHQCVQRNQRLAKKAEPKPRKMYAERMARHSAPASEGFSMDEDYLWYGLGALALGGGIAAIVGKGSGGGHSSGSSGGSGGGLSDMTKAEFQTSEYKYGNFLDAINAADAYAKIYKKDANSNIFGVRADGTVGLAKIKVGIIDGKVSSHNEYSSKIKAQYTVKSAEDEIDATTSDVNLNIAIQDLDTEIENTIKPQVSLNAHGTHVAGIIAADRNNTGMHGVAFENAELYTATWDLDATKSILPSVKTMIDNGVSVINNSWGYAGDDLTANDTEVLAQMTDLTEAYAYAAKNGVVWVQSTGNMAMRNANLYNGLPMLDLSEYGYSGPRKYEAPYLAVTSLDLATATTSAPSGKLASYSNWCGSTKDYCLAAPGSQVEATGASGSGSIVLNGTSMATPAVSGSIALLMGYYPYLSAQNVAWLLLDSANNTGEYANSTKYGRGALDLDKAINYPVGKLSMASDSSFSSLEAASRSRLALSGTVQKQVLKAMPKTVTAFDELHRPFAYDTSNLVSTTHGSNAHLKQEVAHAAMVGTKKVIKDEKSGFSFASSDALDKGGRQNLSSIEIVRDTDNGSSKFYYAENSQYATSDNVVMPTANPYFAMNEAYGAENTMKLSNSSKLKLSLQTGENGLYDRDREQDHVSFDDRAYAFGAEYSFNLTDYLELATVGGMLYEENAMLGMNGEGGFAIKDGSTYYMGLKAALNLTPNFSLLAAYYRGYTQGQDAALLALSDLTTESYMIAGEYKLNNTDKIGLSLSSPLSVVKGKATFNYASGRDNYSDTIYMQKLSSSLKPAAKEYDLGLYYQGEPKENLNLLGKFETRFNADGEKGQTDYIGLVGISKSF